MSDEKHCPDCATTLDQKDRPAENELLAQYECMNTACPTGPVFTVDVSSATRDHDAMPPIEALEALATSLAADAREMRGMLEILGGLGKRSDT